MATVWAVEVEQACLPGEPGLPEEPGLPAQRRFSRVAARSLRYLNVENENASPEKVIPTLTEKRNSKQTPYRRPQVEVAPQNTPSLVDQPQPRPFLAMFDLPPSRDLPARHVFVNSVTKVATYEDTDVTLYGDEEDFFSVYNGEEGWQNMLSEPHRATMDDAFHCFVSISGVFIVFFF